MCTSIKSLLALAVFGLTSGSAMAEIYNHGNHNDSEYFYHEGVIETMDCGSASLASCINAVNIETFAKSRCEAIKNVGVPVPYGDPYWHSVQSHYVRPVSATDGNNGVGAYDYTIELIFTCSGLLHPGTRIVSPL